VWWIKVVFLESAVNKVSENNSEIRVLNEGIGVEYSGDNRKVLSEIGEFQFTAYEAAIADLYKYYKERINTLDANAIKQDAFLGYAKTLHNKYFSKHYEK